MVESEEMSKWLQGLKPGDAVGVFEFKGKRLVHNDVVASRTPGGRIVSEKGGQFKADGYLYAARGSCYASRRLGQVSTATT